MQYILTENSTSDLRPWSRMIGVQTPKIQIQVSCIKQQVARPKKIRIHRKTILPNIRQKHKSKNQIQISKLHFQLQQDYCSKMSLRKSSVFSPKPPLISFLNHKNPSSITSKYSKYRYKNSIEDSLSQQKTISNVNLSVMQDRLSTDQQQKKEQFSPKGLQFSKKKSLNQNLKQLKIHKCSKMKNEYNPILKNRIIAKYL